MSTSKGATFNVGQQYMRSYCTNQTVIEFVVFRSQGAQWAHKFAPYASSLYNSSKWLKGNRIWLKGIFQILAMLASFLNQIDDIYRFLLSMINNLSLFFFIFFIFVYFVLECSYCHTTFSKKITSTCSRTSKGNRSNEPRGSVRIRLSQT